MNELVMSKEPKLNGILVLVEKYRGVYGQVSVGREDKVK